MPEKAEADGGRRGARPSRSTRRAGHRLGIHAIQVGDDQRTSAVRDTYPAQVYQDDSKGLVRPATSGTRRGYVGRGRAGEYLSPARAGRSRHPSPESPGADQGIFLPIYSKMTKMEEKKGREFQRDLRPSRRLFGRRDRQISVKDCYGTVWRDSIAVGKGRCPAVFLQGELHFAMPTVQHVTSRWLTTRP